MFKQITFMLLTILILQSTIPSVLAAPEPDQYQFLRSLNVDEVLSTDNINQRGGSLYSHENNKYIYTFQSSKSTNPHILYTNSSGKITFLQLTIPTSQSTSIQDEFNSYGPPEATYEKTKDEILLAYPSLGRSLIVNGDITSPDRVMYYSPKTIQEHAQQEAINYTSIYQYAAPSIQPSDSIVNFALTPLMILVAIVFVISVVVIIFKRRRHH